MIEPKIGMRFFDAFSGTHTITAVNGEYILHTYKDDGGREVKDAFMYRKVFEKLANANVLAIL